MSITSSPFPSTNFNLNRLFDIDWTGINITKWSPGGDYNISLVTDFLHRIPRFGIQLKQLNNTSFDPSDNEYLESLGILVAIPGFWLILTLLFFLIFFLCRCCDVNSKKKKSLGCCKCCLFMFTMVSILIITIGILGNLRAHVGIDTIHNHTLSISNIVDQIRNETTAVENTLETRVDEDLNKISRKLIGPLVRNYTVLNHLQEQLLHMRRNVTKGIHRIGEMNTKIERVDMSYIPRAVEQIETIRLPATFAILTSFLSFCFLLLCGICKHSRCLLILFSVLGLLSIVISFVLTSFYLGLALGGSDFCYSPKPFISKQFNSLVDSQIVNYYLECDVRALVHSNNQFTPLAHSPAVSSIMPPPILGSAPGYLGPVGPTNNPFRKQLRDIRKSLDGFEEGLFRAAELCEVHCPDIEVKDTVRSLKNEAKKIQESVTLLSRVTECHDVHIDYLFIMSATCRETLEGIVLMMLSAAATGILFTFLVLCASHTWINIRKKRPPAPDTTDETEAFLAPTSATSTGTSNKSSTCIGLSGSHTHHRSGTLSRLGAGNTGIADSSAGIGSNSGYLTTTGQGTRTPRYSFDYLSMNSLNSSPSAPMHTATINSSATLTRSSNLYHSPLMQSHGNPVSQLASSSSNSHYQQLVQNLHRPLLPPPPQMPPPPPYNPQYTPIHNPSAFFIRNSFRAHSSSDLKNNSSSHHNNYQ